MTNSMIEAAARAMYERDMPSGYRWDESSNQQHYVDLATAALRAMMEAPVTDKMYSKWMGGSPPFTQDWRGPCNRDWRALLGAVIEGA